MKQASFICYVSKETLVIYKKPASRLPDLLVPYEVIATALLDRLLYRCEVINLTGESHRLKNRQTFLEA